MNRFECLESAVAAVTHRQESYGSPEDNATLIARLWAAILGADVEPYQVALCMAAVKIARLANDPSHSDSWVDLAGYGAYGAEVVDGVNLTTKRPGKCPDF
ncbi:DUF6378 domain-containing protein [Roseixanthobacter pseudopolyaromaticivorans]|uniref:DUF6378 domain-containing protein n=1 Tax=Xanthobacteraceae TaxID=335928 RepID=UPI003727ADE9